METQNVAFDASRRPYMQEAARTHLLFPGGQCSQSDPVTFTPASGKSGEKMQQLSCFESSVDSLESLKQKPKHWSYPSSFVGFTFFPFVVVWSMPCGAISCPLKTWQFSKSSFWHFLCLWNQMSGNDYCTEIFTRSPSSFSFRLLGKAHQYWRSVLSQTFPKISLLLFFLCLLVVVRNIASGGFTAISTCAEA